MQMNDGMNELMMEWINKECDIDSDGKTTTKHCTGM